MIENAQEFRVVYSLEHVKESRDKSYNERRDGKGVEHFVTAGSRALL